MENDLKAIVERHRAWKAAYDAASPEEKERMVAEKKAQREREEKERQQRIYDDRKKRFVEKANHQIEILQALIQGRKIAFEVISQFDGKVLNNRLTKAVSEKMKSKDDSLWADLTISYDRSVCNNMGKLEISRSHYYEAGLYDKSSIEIILSPLSDGNRVMAALTLSDENNSDKSLTDRISSWKKAIKDYDKTYKTAMKLSESIEKYGKETNVYLSEFFRAEYLIKTYYL